MMLGYTIRKMNSKLKVKSKRVQDVLVACLKKTKETEDLNAFISFNLSANVQAENCSRNFNEGTPRSLLEGIPIAVKDNFCVKGMATTCGSFMLKNFKPQYTATVVEKLFNSGAILIGKTNMDEFAMGSGTTTSIYGPSKNVWGSKHSKTSLEDNDWFISGGSSGGSAVAVASGTCLGALGSDTGGSCRNPASYCGVVGLKPTYGLLSRHGLIPLVNSMDVPGVLALNVEDASILLAKLHRWLLRRLEFLVKKETSCFLLPLPDVSFILTAMNILSGSLIDSNFSNNWNETPGKGLMAGHDEKDSTTVAEDIDLNINFSSSSVKGLKIGIPMEYNCEGLTDEIRSTWNDVAQILEEGGATVVPMSMPHTKYSIVCYSILNQCEVASNMARYDGVEFGHRSNNWESVEKMFADTRTSGFNQVVRSRILAGNYFLLSDKYEKYFVKAMKVRKLILDDFTDAWRKGFKILLTPTTLTDAPRYSEYILKDEREQCATQDYCTQPANMAGCPAISIPIELSKKGLPLSLQLMAPNFEEKILLETARYIENAVNFAQYR